MTFSYWGDWCMNREQLREYVKQLPQEEVLRELLISQVDCNTKLEEVRAIVAKAVWKVSIC